MAIKTGERMPEGQFGIMTADGPGQISTSELFDGKKVVLFSVPGAFTPGCSMKHLPGYVEQADALAGKGVDTIACMAVNDVFVMDAWGKDRGVGDKVVMLADGNGEYAQALGLVMDASGFGMGTRGKRFAAVVNDGVVEQIMIDEDGQVNLSAADKVLAAL